MKIIPAPSKNFNERTTGKTVKYLILHYTDTPDAAYALRLLQGSEPAVSAHYLVDTDGTVMPIVDEKNRAWHAGKSYWEGEEDINSCSIGIEIQNAGHGHGYVPFPDVQIEAVIELCQEIIARYNILPWHVLAHSDVAPDRKKDPGELFPWQRLAENGVGLWFADSLKMDAQDVVPLLSDYGYNPNLDAKTLTTAFQRHFEPEVFSAPEQVGVPTTQTAARLQSLVRQKNKR